VLEASLAAGSAPVGDATVVRVVGVATLDVVASGDVYRVRLAGIAFPAVQGVVGCYGEEARAFTASLVPPGSSLALEAAHGAAVLGSPIARFAWFDGELINRTIVEAGYALVSDVAVDTPHRAELLAAERQAARSVAGLWGAGVADHRERDGLSCESLSGYFSGTHVGVSGGLRGAGVPH
jgi:micrococcal nuclease